MSQYVVDRDGAAAAYAAVEGTLARGPAVPQGLSDLYRSERAAMVRLAHLMCGSNETACDIVHEAFIRLQRNWAKATDPRAYLRKIVVNLCRAHHRRRAVEHRHAAVATVPPPYLAPELDETWHALAKLSPKRRVALVLRYYEDLSIEEVARAMGCRVGTAKSLIHRGLESLRQELQ
jgi:RNA polymerase sigma factor (sigma-70 family)